MLDTLNQYFCMVSKMRNPNTNGLTKAIIRDTGLPELLATTSSPALKRRIEKEITNGFQSNQHAG